MTLRSAFASAAAGLLLGTTASGPQAVTATDQGAESFYPSWAVSAPFNTPLLVRDTDGALGRLSLQAKRLTLEDVARVHGHLCDGLAIAWVALGAGLRSLFPDGVVDRTDVKAVSKNGPCWADAAAWTTGTRLNHGTLVLDNAVGDAFVLQRSSTGRAVNVQLRPGVFPADLAELERSIRSRRATGQTVGPAEVDLFEAMAERFMQRLLSSPAETVVQVQELTGFVLPGQGPDLVAPRSDIINRALPRTTRH